MDVGSMFAGIGGMCLAFSRAGADVIWANDWSEKACRTYRLNFGKDYLVEGDISLINRFPKFDILSAGFPCQPFSVAGRQNGFDDDRGDLFFEIIRVLNSVRPRAFLLENVKNLVGHDEGETFRIMRKHLAKSEYVFKHAVMSAHEHGNVPQSRERIFMVGFRDPSVMSRFSFPPPIELTVGIQDILDTSVEKPPKYYYSEDHPYHPELMRRVTSKQSVYQWRRGYVRELKSGLCPTLMAHMGTGGHNVPIILDDFGIRKLTPYETLMFQGFPNGFALPDIADSHLYQQVGNSVAVPVVERIATNMIRALDD